MFDCLILGDSIAVGIAKHRPDCVVHAQVGINSRDWNNKFIGKNLDSNTVIISLGSNDHGNIKTLNELVELRENLKSKKVFWILPANNANTREVVRSVATKFQDTTIDIPYISKDNVHPSAKGYRELAEKTK